MTVISERWRLFPRLDLECVKLYCVTQGVNVCSASGFRFKQNVLSNDSYCLNTKLEPGSEAWFVLHTFSKMSATKIILT